MILPQASMGGGGGGRSTPFWWTWASPSTKISHKLLAHKLWHYGIGGNVLQWISSFLRNRSQQVLSRVNTLHLSQSLQAHHRVVFWDLCYSLSSSTTCQLYMSSVCWWQFSVQQDNEPAGCTGTTTRPDQSSGMGEDLENVLQPIQMWSHPHNTEKSSSQHHLPHPWPPTTISETGKVPWSHSIGQTIMYPTPKRLTTHWLFSVEIFPEVQEMSRPDATRV